LILGTVEKHDVYVRVGCAVSCDLYYVSVYYITSNMLCLYD